MHHTCAAYVYYYISVAISVVSIPVQSTSISIGKMNIKLEYVHYNNCYYSY